MNFLKTKLQQLLTGLFACLFFLSCQKDIDYVKIDGEFPDLTTKVNSSVSGFVIDENNSAVMGANVSVGGMFATTDKYGYFEVKNVQVVKNAAVVTVTKPNYFKGIKTYLAENNKSAFFRIKLIPKTTSGSIDAATGGNVALNNGLIVALPANAVVKASDNSPYTGTVNVASHWIDPTAADLNLIMPGDLRGVATDGSLKLLQTFGMAAVELTSASGELLQIAAGKKATLTLTIPASILADAPTTIPLWSFDETNGLWKQEGTATKTGNTYVGDVSHFSFWNCDVPNNYIQFDVTLKDPAGNPMPFMPVLITDPASPNTTWAWGWTDATGYVAGAVPNNANLRMEVFPAFCGSVLYSQDFTTTNVDLSLGTITIPLVPSVFATIEGTVTNCSGSPVTDGYLVIQHPDQWYYRYELDNTGAFNVNYILCSGPQTLTFIAEDNIGLEQSAPMTATIVPGANDLGNLQACGTSIVQFITYSIDGGTPIEIAYPNDTLYHDYNPGSLLHFVSGHSNGIPPHNVMFSFNGTSIGVGSMQTLFSFSCSEIPSQQLSIVPTTVNITEYGAVGEYISGNFTGTVQDIGVADYNIVCSFRVRRAF